jgi:hypothetical protein
MKFAIAALLGLVSVQAVTLNQMHSLAQGGPSNATEHHANLDGNGDG